MSFIRKISFLALALLLLLSFSCNFFKNTPEKSTKKFFSLLDDGKINEASMLLSKDSKTFGKKKTRYILKSISNNIQSHKGIKEIKVTEKNIKEKNSCSLTLKIIFNDNYRVIQEIKLVKEKKEWKINLSSLMF